MLDDCWEKIWLLYVMVNLYSYENIENDSFIYCYVIENFLVILINILLLIYCKNCHGSIILYLKIDYY